MKNSELIPKTVKRQFYTKRERQVCVYLKLLVKCVCMCMCVSSLVCCGLTLREAWRVVIHIRQGDVDHSGPGQASSLPGHVLGFDHHLVVLPLLPVHVGRTQSCPDDACQKTHLISPLGC